MEPVRTDIELNTSNYHKDLEKLFRLIRHDWNFTDVEVKQATGGCLNTLLLCHHETSGETLVVRCRDGATLFDPVEEWKMMVYLSNYGLSQPVYCIFKNGIIYGYNEGSHLTAEMIKNVHIQRLVNRELARFHTTPLPDRLLNTEPRINLFVKKWLDAIPEDFPKNRFCNSTFGDAIGMTKEDIWLEWTDLYKKILDFDDDVVICHHDTGIMNLIYDPLTDRVRCVDFEICGLGFAGFEVATHLHMSIDPKTYDKDTIPELKDERRKRELFHHYLSSVKEFKGLPPDVSEEEVELFFNKQNTYMSAVLLFYGIFGIFWALTSDDKFAKHFAITRMHWYNKYKNRNNEI